MNKLVMEKKHINYSNYTYGSVAYDFEPAVVEKKKINKGKSKKVNSKKVKNRLRLISFICLMSALSLFVLSRYSHIVKMTYDVRSIKKEIVKMQKQNDNVAVEIAKHNNIRNIETAALNQFGMVVPPKDMVIYVDIKPLTPLEEENKSKNDSFIHRILGFIN